MARRTVVDEDLLTATEDAAFCATAQQLRWERIAAGVATPQEREAFRRGVAQAASAARTARRLVEEWLGTVHHRRPPMGRMGGQLRLGFA